MNALIIKNVIRFLILVFVQVLVLKQVNIGTTNFDYIHFFIYPLAIILLPIDTSKVAVLIYAFFLGLTIDVFYDSPGVHAAACVFMAFLRPFILTGLAPDTGFKKTSIPTASSFGLIWYLQYSGLMMVAFLSVYFSLRAFTFVYIIDILANTFFSFLASMVVILLHQILFVPES